MILSKRGEDFIKAFESCSLKACKASLAEKYYTIGWGHYGPDVRPDQVITRAAADELFRKDISKYYPKGNMTQLAFDSLTSFHYNCGINAKESWSVRNAYTKCGKQELAGLVRRRKAEMLIQLAGYYSLSLTPCSDYLKSRNLGLNSIKSYKVLDTMIIQWALKAKLKDGIFGTETDKLVRQFQKNKGLVVDGIVGPATWSCIQKLKF